MLKINNIEKIKNFIINDKNESLLINQVNDDIGEFYPALDHDIFEGDV